MSKDNIRLLVTTASGNSGEFRAVKHGYGTILYNPFGPPVFLSGETPEQVIRQYEKTAAALGASTTRLPDNGDIVRINVINGAGKPALFEVEPISGGTRVHNPWTSPEVNSVTVQEAVDFVLEQTKKHYGTCEILTEERESDQIKADEGAAATGH